MPQRGALVIYGHAADLGNFKLFADDLAATDLKSYGTNISIKNIQSCDDFFQLLRKPPLIIQELHIYTHAIGAALYLGYGVEQFGKERAKTINQYMGKRTPYAEVLRTEQGGVLTDDLIRPPYSSYRDEIRKNFDQNAKIKIWGCNSGVKNWVYSDPTSETDHNAATGDPNVPALYYYWRSLNEINTPKPSIAQAFADYFNVTTYGAGSGSNIQIFYKGKWMWADEKNLKAIGRRYVGEKDVLRLEPTGGVYYEYKPRN